MRFAKSTLKRKRNIKLFRFGNRDFFDILYVKYLRQFCYIMNIRQKRLADTIRSYAGKEVMDFEQFHKHEFGIINVTEVFISDDYEYADIFVASQGDDKNLPHFL